MILQLKWLRYRCLPPLHNSVIHFTRRDKSATSLKIQQFITFISTALFAIKIKTVYSISPVLYVSHYTSFLCVLYTRLVHRVYKESTYTNLQQYLWDLSCIIQRKNILSGESFFSIVGYMKKIYVLLRFIVFEEWKWWWPFKRSGFLIVKLMNLVYYVFNAHNIPILNSLRWCGMVLSLSLL